MILQRFLHCPFTNESELRQMYSELITIENRTDELVYTLMPCQFFVTSFFLSSIVFQCCDLGYHASLARTLRTYLSAEYNLETSRHEGLDLIESAVDNLDSRSDKHKIMDMCNQVFCPPMRFEYLPHMGDEVRESDITTASLLGSSKLNFLWHTSTTSKEQIRTRQLNKF